LPYIVLGTNKLYLWTFPCLFGAKPLNQEVSNGSWLKRQCLFLGVSTSKETQMVDIIIKWFPELLPLHKLLMQV